VAGLTGALRAGARERGFDVATPAEHGALIALRAHDAPALAARLGAEGVITSSRGPYLRVSPHFYNEARDIDCLLDALTRHADLLVSG
jgi:selenocysteine lyase/cysteine desulfurase